MNFLWELLKLNKVPSVFGLLFLSIVLIGCNGIQGNPTPKDFFTADDADIFLFKDVVYSNSEHVEWVTESDYTRGEEMAEITKQASSAWWFTNGTANKLPVGTRIFYTDSGFVIAIVGEKEIPYVAMIEG